MDRRLLRPLVLPGVRELVGVNNGGAAGLAVLLRRVPQLLQDDFLHPPGVLEDVLQIVNFILEGLRLLYPLQDVLFIDVAELDFRHVLRLHLVDAKADHQIRDDLGLLLRLPDDADGLVNVQQDALEALEEVELFPPLPQDEEHPPPHGLRAPGGPLLQNPPDPQHLGHPADEDVEVAGKGVLQGGLLEEAGHELVRVRPPLEVNGELEAGEVRLVPHVGDFLGLARLDKLRHLVQNRLGGGGIGYLRNLNEVFFLDVAPLGPDLHAAPSRGVDVPEGVPVADQLPAGGKVRGGQGLQQIAVRVFEVGRRRVADLF